LVRCSGTQRREKKYDDALIPEEVIWVVEAEAMGEC